jgi:hypothetical protein
MREHNSARFRTKSPNIRVTVVILQTSLLKRERHGRGCYSHPLSQTIKSPIGVPTPLFVHQSTWIRPRILTSLRTYCRHPRPSDCTSRIPYLQTYSSWSEYSTHVAHIQYQSAWARPGILTSLTAGYFASSTPPTATAEIPTHWQSTRTT